MRRRVPPLVGDYLIAPHGSAISETASVRPSRSAVIVFWSAGCEASLERLRQLATWYNSTKVLNEHDPVEILTVHSPRFPSDEHVDDVALAMARNQIPFPAIHDPSFKTWHRYNPEGWPTTVVIERGYVVGLDHGLAPITQVLNRLDRQPMDPAELGAHAPTALSDLVGSAAGQHRPDRLSFPQGITMNGDQMLIADTGNNRILAGRIRPSLSIFVVDRIYDGLARPTSLVAWGTQGIAVIEDDRRLSRIDSATGATQLISEAFVRPSGLCVDTDDSLVVTDAAANRIDRIVDTDNDQPARAWSPRPIGGTGRVGTRAGRADAAEFAQPTAVVRTEPGLVIADAASSSLRLLTNAGRVLNVTDGDLYRFGLVDGAAHRAFLQRPSGLCVMPNGDVIVADSGNHHLRILSKRRVESLPVSGLRYPMAVTAVDNDWVAVADTNNHRVVLANRFKGLVHELGLGGLAGAARSTDLGDIQLDPARADSFAS